MGFIRRMADTLWSGRDGHRDPSAELTTARWHQRMLLADVERDLEEAADEQAYVESEITHSKDHAARLDTEAAAAAAGGFTDIARELHEELNQTYAFLGELDEVHRTLIAERSRLAKLHKHLTDHLAASEEPVETVTEGTVHDAGALADAWSRQTAALAAEEARPDDEF